MFVIGAGRIGTALHQRAAERGQPCTLVTRDEGWDLLEGGPGAPILVAVRNDDLERVVARVPVHRLVDLVFIQNGMLRPWLRAHGLPIATRGLLYFAVPSRGAPIQPGGVSPFFGQRAPEAVSWLVELGLEAQVVNWPRFCSRELEKLIWNAAFGLLCEHLDTDVGGVCTEHFLELRSLVSELRRVGRAALGIDVPLEFLLHRLCTYSSTIPRYRGSVKEWEYRNGWLVRAAEEFRVSTPLHRELLHAIGKLDGP
jgi:hypothetical protein